VYYKNRGRKRRRERGVKDRKGKRRRRERC
jgi:hypothetical protein